MRVLIIGASGMLGSAVFRLFASCSSIDVYGTIRAGGYGKFFPEVVCKKLIPGVDVDNHDSLVDVFGKVSPDLVVNCVGLVKQLSEANDPLVAVPINSLLPHRLAALCKVAGARLVHISTDCVFSGAKGGYLESDFPDAYDLYGRTKLLGEVDYPHAITLRTSIIGHELSGARSLLSWFLSQEGQVKGFTKAIFSGLPTNELARVVRDFVIPNPELRGLYHVAAQPIDKYSLLKLVAEVYGKSIDIVPDDQLTIDRSLNADRFRLATGYVAPEWPELIKQMHDFN